LASAYLCRRTILTEGFDRTKMLDGLFPCTLLVSLSSVTNSREAATPSIPHPLAPSPISCISHRIMTYVSLSFVLRAAEYSEKFSQDLKAKREISQTLRWKIYEDTVLHDELTRELDFPQSTQIYLSYREDFWNLSNLRFMHRILK
jgi:hypothetical protein